MYTSRRIFVLCAALVHAAENCKGTWTELAPIPIIPRQENAAVGINSTTLAVLGGIRALGAGWNNTDLVTYYDIPSDTWHEGPPLPIGLNHPNGAAVDGKIYLLGGLAETEEGPWDAIQETWVLDPASGRWEDLSPFPEGMQRGSSVVAVHGSKIFLVGGLRSLDPRRGGAHVAVAEVSSYDTLTGLWETHAALPVPKDHAAGAIAGNTLWVTGGRHITGGTITTRDVYALNLEDLNAGWEDLTQVAGLPTARGGHIAGAIGGLIYTFGGEGNLNSASAGVFNETEVFDTRSRTWKSLDAMPLPRHGTVGVVVEGGIYIPGGGLSQGPHPTNTTEVFRP